jgi:hypothetical protein
MKRITFVAAAIATTCGLIGAPSFAQTGPTATPPAAADKTARPRMDANGDGFITREEAKGRPMLEKNFDAIDTNKDGKLSREEMKAAHEQHKAEHAGHHPKIDANGDKMISRDEAKGHPRLEKNFDTIDTNKDGKLSPEEMKAFRASKHPSTTAAGTK